MEAKTGVPERKKGQSGVADWPLHFHYMELSSLLTSLSFRENTGTIIEFNRRQVMKNVKVWQWVLAVVVLFTDGIQPWSPGWLGGRDNVGATVLGDSSRSKVLQRVDKYEFDKYELIVFPVEVVRAAGFQIFEIPASVPKYHQAAVGPQIGFPIT